MTVFWVAAAICGLVFLAGSGAAALGRQAALPAPWSLPIAALGGAFIWLGLLT